MDWRPSLAQLNDYIFGSQFAVLYLFDNRSERKAQLRVRIHYKRLRSAIGARVSYCLSSSGDTSKAPASFAKIFSEGNRLPSSMSERKGEEIPILFANPRKDKSALSRNSWIRWPKEISNHVLANKAHGQYRLTLPSKPLFRQHNRQKGNIL